MNNSDLGLTSALLSTFFWALCAVILKKLGEKLDPVGMTVFKALISTVLLFSVIVITGKIFVIDSEYLIPVILSGILGIAIGDALFFASLNRLSPLVLSIIIFTAPDIFSGIFGFVFLNEIPTKFSLIGIILIFLGLMFLIFPIKDDGNNSKTTLSGVVYALLSIVLTSYSMVIIKPVLQEVSVITATMYRMFSAGVFLLIFGIISKKFFGWISVLKDKNYTLKLSSTFVLATFGGFLLSLYAIKNCNLITASALMSLEPLFILFLMIVCYKYKPRFGEYLGAFIIFCGINLIYLG